MSANQLRISAAKPTPAAAGFLTKTHQLGSKRLMAMPEQLLPVICNLNSCYMAHRVESVWESSMQDRPWHFAESNGTSIVG
jgi:hypothetical protein